MKHFTREVLEANEADNKVQLTTFKTGLKSREFVVALAKGPPKTMVEMLLKAQKYMNAKDALVAIGEEGTPKEKENVKEDRRGHKKKGGIIRPTLTEISGETVKFTPLVMLADKILM